MCRASFPCKRNEYQEYFLGGGGVKAAGVYGWQLYHLHVPIVMKSGSLNFLEPSGSVQARNGIALHFTCILYNFNYCNQKMNNFVIKYVPQQSRCVVYTQTASKFFYSPTDVQLNCLKSNFKIYIKIYIKTAPTCFGAITTALFELAKVTVVKIIN
jgi:hypothetical protein